MEWTSRQVGGPQSGTVGLGDVGGRDLRKGGFTTRFFETGDCSPSAPPRGQGHGQIGITIGPFNPKCPSVLRPSFDRQLGTPEDRRERREMRLYLVPFEGPYPLCGTGTRVSPRGRDRGGTGRNRRGNGEIRTHRLRESRRTHTGHRHQG